MLPFAVSGSEMNPILGVSLDRSLTFNANLEKMRKKINTWKLTGTTWGSNAHTRLEEQLYHWCTQSLNIAHQSEQTAHQISGHAAQYHGENYNWNIKINTCSVVALSSTYIPTQNQRYAHTVHEHTWTGPSLDLPIHPQPSKVTSEILQAFLGLGWSS